MGIDVQIGSYYIGKNKEIIKLTAFWDSDVNGPGQVDFQIIKDPNNIWKTTRATWTYTPLFQSYFTLAEFAEVLYV